MTVYLVPVTDDLVEEVAKSMAKDDIIRSASAELKGVVGEKTVITDLMVTSIESMFEVLWNGKSPQDQIQKENYRNLAVAAIRTINRKLIVATT